MTLTAEVQEAVVNMNKGKLKAACVDRLAGSVEADLMLEKIRAEKLVLLKEMQECKELVVVWDDEIDKLKAELCALKRMAEQDQHRVKDEMMKYVDEKLKEERAKNSALNESLKKHADEQIKILMAENMGLKERLSVISTPQSATQVIENPENLARINDIAELHVTRLEYNDLVQDHALLLDHLRSIEAKQTPEVEKEIENNPSVISMVQRIKDRTHKQDRKPLDITPAPNTAEIITLDGVNASKAQRKGEPPVLRLTGNYFAMVNTDTTLKTKFYECWRHGDESALVWEGAGPTCRVLMKDIVHLLRHESLSSNVLDSWAQILLHKHQNLPRAQRVKYFSSLCWGLICETKCAERNLLKSWVDDRLMEVDEFDVLLFPMLTKGTRQTTRDKSDHWTMVKLNLATGEWVFYNSRRPRSNRCQDVHYNRSQVLIDYVEKILRNRFTSSKPMHCLLQRTSRKPLVADCLQQAEDSFDCGLVQCINIENEILGIGDHGGNYTHMEAEQYRAGMVLAFSINL